MVNMKELKFRVELLEEAKQFLDSIDEKSREKIIYNIWKSRGANDKEPFKKLQDEIWEFRTQYNKIYYRLFAFWDKADKKDTIVISTHGIIKKTDKISKKEIEKAKRIRQQYLAYRQAGFNEKINENENI